MGEPVLKLCKHCRFFRLSWLDRSASRCGHDQAIEGAAMQLVDGSAPRRQWCSDMRREHHACGRDGKLWEPRS